MVFSDKAVNRRYKNRRGEMWLEMAQWVKNGAALAAASDLVGQLAVQTYSFVRGKFVLEEKEQIKERLGRRPDLADALALTFALPDQTAQVLERLQGRQTVLHDGDPFERTDTQPNKRVVAVSAVTTSRSYTVRKAEAD